MYIELLLNCATTRSIYLMNIKLIIINVGLCSGIALIKRGAGPGDVDSPRTPPAN